MSRMRFRAANSFARHVKTAPRIIERLEPRCVLSANPIYALPAGPPVVISDIAFADHSVVAQDRFLDPQMQLLGAGSVDRMDPNSFDHAAPIRSNFDRGHGAAFGMPGGMNGFEPELPRIEIAQSAFGFSQAFSAGFIVPQYEIILIYGNSPLSAPNNYAEVSAPDATIAYNLHSDASIASAAKPGVAPFADSAPHVSLPNGPNSEGGAPVRPLVAEVIPAATANSSNAAMVHFGSAPQLSGGGLQAGAVSSRIVQPLQERIVIHATQGVVLPASDAANGGSAAPDAPSAAKSVAETPLQTVAVAAMAPPADAVSIDVPVDRASLAELPLNLLGVEQALQTVMSRISVLGAELHGWLDDTHLTPMIAAVAGVALGAGGAAYLRRRGAAQTEEHDEEASSSWLFARLQTLPGEG
jgi:hypothetical protein